MIVIGIVILDESMLVAYSSSSNSIIFLLDIGISFFLGFQFPLLQNKQKRKDYNRNRDFYYVVTKYYQSNQLFRIFYSKDGGKSTEQDSIFFS